MKEIVAEVSKVVMAESVNIKTGETKKVPVTIKIVTHVNKEGCTCLICPNCGAHEVDHDWKPTTEEEKEQYIFGCRFNIRAYKVDDWSHCLKCDKWFDKNGNVSD